MCFGCSKEPFIEYPQQMRNKKNNFQLCTLIWRHDILLYNLKIEDFLLVGVVNFEKGFKRCVFCLINVCDFAAYL